MKNAISVFSSMVKARSTFWHFPTARAVFKWYSFDNFPFGFHSISFPSLFVHLVPWLWFLNFCTVCLLTHKLLNCWCWTGCCETGCWFWGWRIASCCCWTCCIETGCWIWGWRIASWTGCIETISFFAGGWISKSSDVWKDAEESSVTTSSSGSILNRPRYIVDLERGTWTG